MDLVSTFSGLQQAQTAQAIQTSVAKKVMDSQRQQGEAAIQLIESAGQTGGNPAGVGGAVDTYG